MQYVCKVPSGCYGYQVFPAASVPGTQSGETQEAIALVDRRVMPDHMASDWQALVAGPARAEIVFTSEYGAEVVSRELVLKPV